MWHVLHFGQQKSINVNLNKDLILGNKDHCKINEIFFRNPDGSKDFTLHHKTITSKSVAEWGPRPTQRPKLPSILMQVQIHYLISFIKYKPDFNKKYWIFSPPHSSFKRQRHSFNSTIIQSEFLSHFISDWKNTIQVVSVQLYL